MRAASCVEVRFAGRARAIGSRAATSKRHIFPGILSTSEVWLSVGRSFCCDMRIATISWDRSSCLNTRRGSILYRKSWPQFSTGGMPEAQSEQLAEMLGLRQDF